MQTQARAIAPRLQGAAIPLAAAGALSLALAPSLLLAGGAALALAGASLVAGAALAWRDPASERAEAPDPNAPREIASLAPGDARVEGVVAPGPERLLAPLSRDACVWYDVRMERLGRGEGGAWGWIPIAREARGSLFHVEDATGRVRARPLDGASLEGLHRFESVNPAHERVREWRARHVPDAAAATAALPEPTLGQGLELRFIEMRLKIGDKVSIEGAAERDVAGLSIAARRGGPARARSRVRVDASSPVARRSPSRETALVAVGVALLALGAAAVLGHPPDASLRAMASLLAP